MKTLSILLIALLLFQKAPAQAYYLVFPLGQAIVPEHGFLPGKKFQYYPTIDKYDFSGRHMRVELTDRRESLGMQNISCSMVELNNRSEFKGETGALTVFEYFQYLLPAAGIVIDSTAGDTLKVELQALDSRLIGFGNITAHGLCQMNMTWKGVSRIYCVDITDKDKHSPVRSNALITRKTATRIITSAAIREVIEQFLQTLSF
jgi:hypothetical protein